MNVLELKRLNKKYAKGPHAVIDLDYSLKKGSITAFLGPNGAGKSTTIGMICGLCRPTSGDILYLHERVNHIPVSYRRSIGVVSQHPNLELDLTVRQNLYMHTLLFGMGRKESREKISRLISDAGLEQKANSLVRSLSGGQKRRVQILRALLHGPEMIILDEPTVGLDPASRADIWEMIHDLKRRGKTILFSTHYMEEAAANGERISIMHQGRIIADGKSEELIRDLGRWCRETVRGNKRETSFFPTKEEADCGIPSDCDQLRIRPTTLEDVFISLTGRGLEK